MLGKRVITSLALAAIGIPAIILGGFYYFALITFFLGVAAWEYGNIFRKMDCNVSEPLVIGGVVLILGVRMYFPAQSAAVLTFSILAAMAWHLLAYEKGRDRAATDFAATTGGIIYLGWIGAYLLDLRNMPGGLWWLVIVLPTIWLADMAAFFVGRRFGRHALSPRLSPKKTWEGYWAGVVFGTLAWCFYGTASEVWQWCGGRGPRWEPPCPS